MKTILCFGDSNTWGFDPKTGQRYSYILRWPGVLQQHLGTKFHVIEEGLNGRTTAWDEPFRQGRNGGKALGPLLETHSPLDLVILALGANDMKPIYHASAYDSALGIESLIQIIDQSAAGPNGLIPHRLVVSPPPFGLLTEETSIRFAGGAKKSTMLHRAYEAVANRRGAFYFNAGDIVTPSTADGVHFDAEAHFQIGEKLASLVKEILDKDLKSSPERGIAY